VNDTDRVCSAERAVPHFILLHSLVGHADLLGAKIEIVVGEVRLNQGAKFPSELLNAEYQAYESKVDALVAASNHAKVFR
jgi:hypothetical protein